MLPNPTGELRAESREPRAESREPRAESREPESREPRAESRERSREPRAESREPRAESREPRAESREPRAESREPRAESREPRAESREPSCVRGEARRLDFPRRPHGRSPTRATPTHTPPARRRRLPAPVPPMRRHAARAAIRGNGIGGRRTAPGRSILRPCRRGPHRPPEPSPPAPGGLPSHRFAFPAAVRHAAAFARLRPALFRAAASLVPAMATLPGDTGAPENQTIAENSSPGRGVHG